MKFTLAILTITLLASAQLGEGGFLVCVQETLSLNPDESLKFTDGVFNVALDSIKVIASDLTDTQLKTLNAAIAGVLGHNPAVFNLSSESLNSIENTVMSLRKGSIDLDKAVADIKNVDTSLGSL